MTVVLGELQIILLRALSARLTECGVPPERQLPMEAACDQLEAAVRQSRITIERRDQRSYVPCSSAH